nr:sugar phosphate isomerase/epimerase [bacterium]
MSKSVLAAQLYTVREFTKTPADIATTMKKVSEIGYEAVQLSAVGATQKKELGESLGGGGGTGWGMDCSDEERRDNTQAVPEENKNNARP